MAFCISAKIDNTVRCPENVLTETPPAPHAVKIELARSCNFRCGFCNHGDLAQTRGEMDFGFYKRLLDELKEIGVQEIAPFFYGESFLSANLPAAIQYAHDKGFAHIFLTTNGSVATPEKVRACMEAGLKSLKFSLNYADAAQFAQITGVPATIFETVKRNIKAAHAVREAGEYPCGLFASYVQYDDAQTGRMRGVIEEMKPYLDEIYALPLYGAPSKLRQQRFWGGNQGRAANPVPPVPCWTLFRAAHVNYDGTLYACCFNIGEQFAMGDLTKQSFMDAWHSEKFRALRRAHLSGSVCGTICTKCICGQEA